MLRYRGYRAVDPLKPYRSYQEKMSSRLYKKATKKQGASRRVKTTENAFNGTRIGKKQKIARARAFHPEWQPFNFNDLLTHTHTPTAILQIPVYWCEAKHRSSFALSFLFCFMGDPFFQAGGSNGKPCF